MSTVLKERTIAILAADGVERVELEEPRNSIIAAGGTVVVLSIASGEIAARDQDLEAAGTVHVDREVGTASVDASAVAFVRAFVVT